ncbi:MAG: CARDB domain-containing protein, partial [Nostocales cyanobacterium ELA583]
YNSSNFQYAPTAYTLSLSAVPGTIIEPGNTLATALDFGVISYSLTSPLAVPVLKEYNDYVGGDDSDDYFKFTIDKRLGSNINLTAPTNTKLELLNDQGNLIKTETSSGGFNSIQIRENLNAGTYYLHLSTTNTTASYYNLDFLISPPDDVSDSFSTAKDLGTLTATPVSNSDYAFYYFGSSSSASFYDSDYYNFTLSQTSTVNFALTDDAQSYTSFSVYRSLGGSSIAGLSNQYSETNATLQKTLAPDTYIVSLSGNGAYNSSTFQSAPTAYTFSLSAVPGTIIDPGNTLATALDFGTISYSLTSPLAVPVLKEYDDYVGGDDSDDYFKFTIDKRLGSNLSINAPANTKLELLNAQGNVIKSGTLSGSFSSTQIRENLDAGTYYLHLSTTNTTASYYNLDLLISPPDNVSDSSSTPKDLGTLTATPVSNSDYVFYYYGSGASLDDYDSYKFTLSQTSTVNFDLTDDAQSYTYLNVYKSPGFSSVANLTNDDTKTSATLQQTLEAGTYTVYLSGNGAYNYSASQSSPTAYTLTLSTVGQPDPSLSISNVTVTEGDSGTLNATFTVNLTAGNDKVVTVDYGTANGTALSGSDYTTTTGTLTFNVGQVSQTITVPVIGNLSAESVENFVVNLTNPTNATITKNQGVGTINDNDTIDLAVTSATIFSEGLLGLGSPILVSWTVTNKGTGTTDEDWNDQIYVSDDQVYDSADTFVIYEDIVEQTPLAGGGSYTITRNITLPNTATGDRYLLFITDGSNSQAETNETNNLIPFSVNIISADLQITAANAPATAVLGETVELTWTVANKGTETATRDWYDTVYLSSDQTYNAGDVQLTSEYISTQTPLVKDGSYTISKNVVLPKFIPGNQYLLFIADSSGYQEEADETNNIKAVPINLAAPDLQVTAATAPTTAVLGETVELTWTVANKGTVTANSGWYDTVYLSSDQTYNAGDVRVTYESISTQTPLAKDGSYTISKNVALPSFTPGNQYLLFIADSYENLSYQGETDETNNTKAVAISLNAPDLIVTNASAPESVTVGQTFSVSWDVKNQGTFTASADWYDRIVVSTDQIFGNNDDTYLTAVWEGALTPLAAAGTYTKTLNVTLPSTATGDRYLLFKVDGYDNQGETDETNNVKAVAINISAADLQVTAATAPTTAVLGETVELTWTVANKGTGTATRDWYDRIYLSSDQTFNFGDVQVTQEYISTQTPLAKDGSYTISKNVVLPSFATGDQYLLFVSDGYGYQGETNENNNTKAVAINLNASDLVVTNITAPTASLSGQTIDISWTVKNQGTVDVEKTWYDSIYLKDTNSNARYSVSKFEYTGGLAAGSSLERTQSYNIPLSLDGDYKVVVTTDSNGNIAESTENELNNTTTDDQTLKIQLSSVPNLKVSSITPPATAFSSQQTIVQWTVTNTGTGATNAPIWYDRVYLSLDQTFDNTDVSLGQAANPSYLNAGDSYPNSLTVNLPRGIDGNYYFLINTDAYSQVAEVGNEGDNWGSSSPTKVSLTPPPDLQVTMVNAPSRAFSGQRMDLSWTVTNKGTGRTLETDWSDRIFMSADEILDASDRILGDFYHSGALNVDQSYTGSATVTLPVGVAGNYFFFVQSDIYNQVYENFFENNNGTRDTTATNITLTPPPDLEFKSLVIPNNARSGGNLSINYKVANFGAAETPNGYWTDKFYLSTDNQLNVGTDINLGSVGHYGVLNPNDSYDRTANFTLSNTLTGTYYVFGVTDSGDQVFEFELNNDNKFSSTNQVQIVAQPADLVVTEVTIPTTGKAGKIIPVQWKIKNQGTGDSIVTNWSDRIVASSDSILGDADDIILANFTHTGLLGANETYTQTENIELPFNLEGDYQLFVITDSNNSVYESSNEENNSSNSFPVTIYRQTPDLQVTGINLPATAQSGQPITLSWTVENLGAGRTNSNYWYDDVYLSLDTTVGDNDIKLGSFYRAGALDPASSYTASETFNLPIDLNGNYYVLVRSDRDNQVIEGALENNNDKASLITATITLSPVADLTVQSIDAPATGISGQTLSVTWTVANNGEKTEQTFYDAVYLSRDQVFDRNSDIYLGYRNHTGLINGGSYTATQSFDIPRGLSGSYYTFVVTDKGNAVYERTGETNNTKFDAVSTAIIIPPPSDLVVTNITTPVSGIPGQGINISYTVKNQGTDTALGTWTDSIYLSKDNQWDIGDALLGQVNHSGDIAGGASYDGTLNGVIPGVNLGNYNIIVRSDIRNQVPEVNESNNAGVSISQISLDVEALAIGTPDTDNLGDGQSIYYRFDATAGQAVRLKLDSSDNQSFNELYVRYGSLPTRGQFDLTTAQPFNADPEIIIPIEKTGTYYILAYGDRVAGTPSYEILAKDIPFSITNVATNSIGNTGKSTLEIRGAKFAANTTFQLRAADGSLIESEKVYLENSTLAYVTFDLFSEKTGLYDLQAKQSNGSTTILEDVVTVNDAIGFDLDANITGPDQVRPSRNYAFNVNYGNTGDRDTIAPLLIVESVTKTQSGTTLNGLASGVPLQLLGVSNEGPQGILRPGDQNVLPVYFNSNTNPIEFQVRTIQADDSTVINWDSLKSSIRPANLTDQQWNSFLSKIVPRVQTYGNYVQMINDMSEQLSSPGNPLYDVRDLFARMYAANPNYQPTSSLSGQLLDAKTGTPLSGVEIAAYEVKGSSSRLGGTTITDKQGNFTILSLKAGTYEMALSDRNFDMNRNDNPDQKSPSFTISQSNNLNDVKIYAEHLSDVPPHINQSEASLTVDKNGLTHIVWNQDNQVWHSYFDGNQWTKASLVYDAPVSKLNIQSSKNLIDGNTDGLVVTWEEGVGNESEIYYEVARPLNNGGYQWSKPIAVTDNNINDTNPEVVITELGKVLIVYLKADENIQDDADLYYDNLSVSSNNLLWTSNIDANDTSLLPQGSGSAGQIAWSFNKKLGSFFGRDIKGEAKLEGTALSTGKSASASLVGKGSVTWEKSDKPKFGYGISFDGQLKAKWTVDKQECDWDFESANLNFSGGGIFDWKDRLLAVIKQLGLVGRISATALQSIITFLNEKKLTEISNGVKFELAVRGYNWEWSSKEPFPNFIIPEKIKKTAIEFTISPYFKGEIISDSKILERIKKAKIEASGKITIKFLVNPSYELLEASGGWTFNVTTPSGHKYQRSFKAGYFSDDTIGIDSLISNGDGLSTLTNETDDGYTAKFSYEPQSLVGSSNVYGNNSLESDVSSDIYQDSSPALAQSSDGTILAAWANGITPTGNQIGSMIAVSQFSQNQWNKPVSIPNSLGFNDNISLIFDKNQKPLIVWSTTNSSSITDLASLTEEDINQIFGQSDIVYSTFQEGTWSSPILIKSTVGIDGGTTLGTTADGNTILVWVNSISEGQENLLVSFWNGQTWTSPQQITTADTIKDISISKLSGKTVVFWTQDINSSSDVIENSIFYSNYNTDNNVWAVPTQFNPAISSEILDTETNTISPSSISSSFIRSLVGPPPEESCKCKEGDPKCDKPPKPPYKPPVVVPKDPNDILGPTGFGENRWIDTDEPFRYTIRFENATTATAPAQEVFITQQLDADLDWRTFRVDDYGWSGAVYELEGNRAFHSTRIDLTKTKGFYVDVAATIDTITGIATWRISTIDPTTGEAPLNAQAGFLPTNDKDGAGEGFVSYSVRTKSTVKTGDVIDAKAQIIFDTEEPIDTPPIFNTLDVNKPTSKVNDLPATTQTPQFLVSWAGTDQGSALASYTIYVSDNNGDFTPWLTDTTLTESNYQGTAGHSYKFYAVAMDNAGNTQD